MAASDAANAPNPARAAVSLRMTASTKHWIRCLHATPVHYASAGGNITSFLDRMFYAGGSQLRTKVGAAVVSARRAGTTSTLDQLNKYFTICGMPIAPSQYWCMVHGSTPEDVRKDEEGMQIMRMLARYMVYMMKSFALARENGLLPPDMEKPKKRTNFIR